MKRYCCGLLSILLCAAFLFSACGAAQQGSEAGSPLQSSDSGGLFGTINMLNKISEEQLSYQAPLFTESNHFSVKVISGLEIYWCGGLDGSSSVFVVREQEDDSCYAFELLFSSITRVNQGENPGEITVYTTSERFLGDQIFYNFSGDVTVDYKSGKIVAATLSSDGEQSQMVGVRRGGDKYRFDEWKAEDNIASVTFALTQQDSGGGDIGEGMVCTEIYVKSTPAYEAAEGYANMTIGFNETELNLPKEFIDSFKAMEGIKNIECTNIGSPAFSGTQMHIVFEDGYTGSCFLNRSGELYCFEDFNITIRKLG